MELQNRMYQKIIDLIKKSNNIVVFTGAGISTNSGILDFRSSDGLYNLIEQKFDLPYPEAIFDLDYFKENPEPFFDLVRNLFSQYASPTVCHEFISWLEEQNKVSIVVTQNSDMLHHLAGSKKVLECHGTFRTAHCLECDNEYQLSEYEQTVLDGIIPHCDCGGLIKPDVIFFGEEIPEDFYRLLNNHPKADLILILGTSLNVLPTSKFALEIAEKVPSILVNLEPTQYDDEMTFVINEDLDKFAEFIMESLGVKL